MKHVNRVPELCDVHRTIRPARIVCTHLPNRLGKALQDLRAIMFLPDLRLVERETQLLSNRRREVRQPIKRVDKPDQLARVFRLLSH